MAVFFDHAGFRLVSFVVVTVAVAAVAVALVTYCCCCSHGRSVFIARTMSLRPIVSVVGRLRVIFGFGVIDDVEKIHFSQK